MARRTGASIAYGGLLRANRASPRQDHSREKQRSLKNDKSCILAVAQGTPALRNGSIYTVVTIMREMQKADQYVAKGQPPLVS